MRCCTVLRPGRLAYGEAYQLQRRLVDRVKSAPGDMDYLILLEHPPVITVGRSGDGTNVLVPRARLAELGVGLFEIDRGGDVTYHGPGQLVGYPIIALQGERKDVHRYLRALEQVLINMLRACGIDGVRDERNTGVWAGGDKLASIGVGVSRWVTFHGFALNVNTDLDQFQLITPCGLQGVSMTSMARLLGRAVDLGEVADRIEAAFAEEFGFDRMLPGDYAQF